MGIPVFQSTPGVADSQPATSTLPRRIRRLFGLCFSVGFALIILSTFLNVDSRYSPSLTIALALVGLVLAATLVILSWQRQHQTLMFMHTALMAVFQAALVAATGGPLSPWTPLLFMLTAFAAVYYRQPVALITAAVIALLNALAFNLGGTDTAQSERYVITTLFHLSIAAAGQLLTSEMAQQRTRAERHPQVNDVPTPVVQRPQIDELTGLENHVGLIFRLNQALAEQRTTGEPFSLVLIGIDNFRALNEKHGYASGDDILRQVAVLLGNHSRRSDIPARYDDGEFMLVLPGANAEIGLKLGQRLRAIIEQHRFWTPHSTTRLAITLSMGIAACPHDGTTAEALIAQANKRMRLIQETHEAGDDGGVGS